MTRLLFAGEALMDCIPLPGDAFRPVPGGSPFNTAVAAARLGNPVGIGGAFMGGLSTDFFGDRLACLMEAEGIDRACVRRLNAPTTLAFVDLSGPSPRYAFNDAGSANRTFAADDVPTIPDATRFVHVGSVSLVGSPGADEFAAVAIAAAAGGRIVSLDPNVRPSLIHARPAFHARMDRLFGIAAVVRASVEDLEGLEPGLDSETFARRLLARGATLVVVTAGAAGAQAWTPVAHVSVPAHLVKVADTIGAGDTVTGAILVYLAERGLETRDAIAALDREALGAMLDLAMRAAAVTCTRAGCDPPRRHELAP